MRTIYKSVSLQCLFASLLVILFLKNTPSVFRHGGSIQTRNELSSEKNDDKMGLFVNGFLLRVCVWACFTTIICCLTI